MDMPPSGKPVASLMPTLLARKGGARPAMRPQLDLRPAPEAGAPDGHGAADPALDDLGWNDMGEEPVPMRGRVVHFPREAVVRAEVPAVKPVARRPRGTALKSGRKAAFTLRLDAERHLKLRLACTVDGSSAQALVTDALDRLLAEIPEIENLAGQVQDTAGKRRQS